MKLLALTTLLALAAMTAPVQAADAKGDLPCRFKSGEIAGSDSYASRVNQHHKSPNMEKAQKTSVGTLTWIQEQESGNFNIVPLINGKRVPILEDNQGTFRSGKVYDLGGKILLAYHVELLFDARTNPSQLTLLLGPGGVVIEEYRLNGEEAWDHACNLLM